jgi:translation initiation factor 1
MNDSTIVYSTGAGRVCPQCSRPVAQCVCKQQKAVAVPQTDGIVRVGREVKGRKGKGVTVISGIPLNAIQLEDMAKRLKQLCGAGGTIKDNVIEIQGEHRDSIADFLKKQGFSVKKSGG